MNKIFFSFLFCLFFTPVAYAMEDFLADEITYAPKPFVNLDYNYSDTFCVPIRLEIIKKISTKDKDLYEGKKLLFRVSETSFYKHRPIVHEGDVVEGKVKFIISSGMNGIPYTLVIDDFKFQNIEQAKLKSEYQKDGFNRTWFVLPLKWALTFLPPTGSLTNFIKGGHAKITPHDKITVYYYPGWE